MGTSFNRRPGPEYSFNWGNTVVNRLIDSSPRATYFFCNYLGMKREWLVVVLCKRPEEWKFLKSAYGYYKRWVEKQRSLHENWPADDPELCKEALLHCKRSNILDKTAPEFMRYIDKQLELSLELGAD